MVPMTTIEIYMYSNVKILIFYNALSLSSSFFLYLSIDIRDGKSTKTFGSTKYFNIKSQKYLRVKITAYFYFYSYSLKVVYSWKVKILSTFSVHQWLISYSCLTMMILITKIWKIFYLSPVSRVSSVDLMKSKV